MDIKAGKYYKLENGLKALITHVHDTNLFKADCKYQGYSFLEGEDKKAEAQTWFEGGKYFSKGASPWDIVSEWPEERIVYLVTMTMPSNSTYFQSLSFTSQEKAEAFMSSRNPNVYDCTLTEVKV